MSRLKKRYLYLLLSVVGIFFNCNKESDNTPRMAKIVPPVYKLVADPAFHFNQDTLYYNSKKFSGVEYELYPTKDTFFVKPFLNGLEEGVHKMWYPSKGKLEERLYVNGKKEGVHKGWWENGKPKYIYHFYNNEYNGIVKEWYASGPLFKFFHYSMGYEEGSERLWYEDGSVRANYVIKGGRKYGLIGVKICRNPFDEKNKK